MNFCRYLPNQTMWPDNGIIMPASCPVSYVFYDWIFTVSLFENIRANNRMQSEDSRSQVGFGGASCVFSCRFAYLVTLFGWTNKNKKSRCSIIYAKGSNHQSSTPSSFEILLGTATFFEKVCRKNWANRATRGNHMCVLSKRAFLVM